MVSGDDAGIGAHMAELQSLVEEEGRLSTVLILATVLEIHTDTIAIRGSVNTMSGQLDTMHNMLGEYGTLLGPSKTEQLKMMLCIANEPRNSRLLACAERRIKGSGEWFLQHDLFMSWATVQADSSQVLAIEAGSKSGKSFSTTAIIHLQEQAQKGGAPSAVAVYFFDELSKAPTSGDVVRSIACQLCVQNLQFFEIAYLVIQQILGETVTQLRIFGLV